MKALLLVLVALVALVMARPAVADFAGCTQVGESNWNCDTSDHASTAVHSITPTNYTNGCALWHYAFILETDVKQWQLDYRCNADPTEANHDGVTANAHYETFSVAPNTCVHDWPLTYSTPGVLIDGGVHCVAGCEIIASVDHSVPPLAATEATGQTCDAPGGQMTCLTGYVSYVATGSTFNQCLPNAGDADGDGIPNSTDTDPKDKGTTADSDGDGIPDNKDSAPNDPNNGKDTTGTESDNVSSGGGDCTAAPVSSGDGIAAQVAFQTWATRCEVQALRLSGGMGGTTNNTTNTTNNTTNNSPTTGDDLGTYTGADANCAAPVQCSAGDSVLCGTLITQWRMRCADDAKGGGLQAIADAGDGMGDVHGSDAWEAAGDPASLDTTGLGASGTCPVFPSLGSLGSIDETKFCELGGWLGWLFVGIALLWGLHVVMS